MADFFAIALYMFCYIMPVVFITHQPITTVVWMIAIRVILNFVLNDSIDQTNNFKWFPMIFHLIVNMCVTSYLQNFMSILLIVIILAGDMYQILPDKSKSSTHLSPPAPKRRRAIAE
jgi:hypothetical protein